jgi:plastocyanin
MCRAFFEWIFTMKNIANYIINTAAIGLFSAFLASAAVAGSVQVRVLDKDGKPAPDAVVVLVHSSASGAASTLATQATVVNEKMQFIPAVTLVAKGAKVRFVNNDPWDHHVRGAPVGALFGAGNPAAFSANASAGGFELRLEGKTEGKPAKFQDITMDKIGAQSAALLGCFMHGSMRGHVYVTDSPWAGKTDANGVASFANVPDGAVQVRLWHADQLVDLPTQAITVSPAAQSVNLQLPFTPRRQRTPAASTFYQ